MKSLGFDTVAKLTPKEDCRDVISDIEIMLLTAVLYVYTRQP